MIFNYAGSEKSSGRRAARGAAGILVACFCPFRGLGSPGRFLKNWRHACSHIAEDVAQRLGVSKEDALTHLTSGGWGAQVGVKSQGSIWGKLAQWGTGFHAGADAHLKFDRNSSSSDKYHTGMDGALSARQSRDFNDAMSYVKQFSQNHHFDDSHSQAASLSNQLGADLREAETASRNVDTSLAKATRIQNAKSFVESHSSQITTDLNQAFPAYVAAKLNESERDELYSHPGDMRSLNKLQALGQDFIASKREELITQFGNKEHKVALESFYQKEQNDFITKENQLGAHYQKNSEEFLHQAQSMKVGIDGKELGVFRQEVHQQKGNLPQKLEQGEQLIKADSHDLMNEKDLRLQEGMVNAQKNVVVPENVHLPKEKRFKLHQKGE
ncbi:hypothetical protein [Legionella sainthelensi]|uniref:hypothetical protein n=1 Tax=Legionella sainthelensi TaxID=28087 RepID=UPI0015F2B30D|nr:hypothetical protein [Legionella sainthelensi]